MNQTLYYKIIHGYDLEDYIQIYSTELQKAYYCFLTKKDAVYSGGAVRGAKILVIEPDYHRMMGWNTGYKLGLLDFADLDSKGIRKKYLKELQEAKEAAQYKLQEGKDIPPKLDGGIDTSALAEKMRLK